MAIPNNGACGTRNSGRVCGVAVAVCGLLLSPMTPWNDIVLNIPLAWLGASALAAFHRPWFEPGFVACYLATNILGLVMLWKGVRWASDGTFLDRLSGWKGVVLDVVASLVLVGLMLVAMNRGLISPLQDYLP